MEDFAVYGEDKLRFVHPFSMLVAGIRGTGKTSFALKLLQRNRELISPPPLDTIIWFYGAAQQDVFDSVRAAAFGQHVEFVHGLPKNKTIQELVSELPGQRKLIVLDDLMGKASNREDVADLFTHGRHADISVLFLSQNFFHKSKYARDISLNVDYAVLMKNTRNVAVAQHLGQQMGLAKFLQEAYQKATVNNEYSHLFIDMRSATPDALRYRANVLDVPQPVYQPD